jgi:hypothetical protein
MPLTPQQVDFLATSKSYESIALRARAGTGKCLGKGTPVLLANGLIKPVEQIVEGDYLAGPNSPRLVLSTCTGVDNLYRVTPTKGDSFICNEAHILTLAGSNRYTGQIIDISVSSILCQPSHFFKSWKLLRSPINYWHNEVTIDPYFYGLWLGDGHCAKCAITTADHEVRNYLSRFASSIGYYIEEKNTHSSLGGPNLNCWDIQLFPNNCIRGGGHKIDSPLWEFLKSSQSGGYKNIRLEYLTAPRHIRLELLAGLLDSDGHLDGKGFEITTKDRFLCEDILHLARSCGFAAYSKNKTVNGTVYKRITISGNCNEIPTKITRKQAPARRQCKRVEVTGFTLTPLGRGDYYGFTLDGDGRFLLGDFTVTHNTYSLQQWANSSPKTGIATSFSKSTVEELVKKITKFPAKTFHALGLQALKGGGKSIKLEKGKMFEIVKALSTDNEIPFELQGEIRSLATIAKVFGVQPNPAGPEGITPNEVSIWEELATQYDIEFSDEILHWSRAAVNASNLAFTKEGVIDFSDMLYCSLIYPHRFSKSPIVLADEVQDFNLLQHTMLKRCLLPSGRVIAAGDDRQAIYAFQGALSNSYTNLVATFNMTELPLTVSFRCPSEVIKVAQLYVPDIEAAPSCIQGAVLYPTNLALADVPKTVLCRNNAPLMRLALRLLVSGRTVEIAGRDIGQNLIKLTERITKKNLTQGEFFDKLDKWKERELVKYPKRKFSINEKFLILRTLASAHKDLDSMRKHLNKLYPDPKSKEYRPADVHLSTIHKAKGREWPSVLFLDSHLIGRNATTEQEQLQEANLSYVGITRAQQELTFITSKQIEGLGD